MTSQETVCGAIQKALTERYPAFPVSVVTSPDDPGVLCVRVFGVPPNLMRELKAAVRNLETEVCPEGDFLLLPLVKTRKITRQHYPEYMQPSAAPRVNRLVEPFMHDAVSKGSVWQPLSPGVAYAIDAHGSLTRSGFDFRIAINGQFKPSQKSENSVAANSELAHAA